jgi:ribosomal protein L21E
MPKITEGERVRVVSREQTEEDAKSCMYYPYFGGLTGEVQKAFNENEIVVDIDPESLTKDIRRRHEDVRDQMKTKWLEGLSEEGRSRLTEREKDFRLHYAILVAERDLEKIGPRAAAAEKKSPEETVTSRRTLEEIEEAEKQELLRRVEKK